MRGNHKMARLILLKENHLLPAVSESCLQIGAARLLSPRMNLEDHLGDIIRKARAMNNISTATAGAAAGLSEGELTALEESGRVVGKINYAALGKCLGLNPQKLEAIANGWLPSPKNLGQWREIR